MTKAEKRKSKQLRELKLMYGIDDSQDEVSDLDVPDDNEAMRKQREIRRKMASATYRSFHKHNVVNALVNRQAAFGKNAV